MLKGTYEFSPKPDQKVVVSFTITSEIVKHRSEVTQRTYCTISVYEPDRTIKHYHGGTVCNPCDKFNERTGMFIAFKKALDERWVDKHSQYGVSFWIAYHKKWSHFLSALMDGKAVIGDYYPDSI